MRRASVTLVLLLAPAVPVGAQQSHADSVVRACMASDTATRWRHVQVAWTDTAGRPWGDDSLRLRLLALASADQSVRDVPNLADSMKDSGFVRRMRAQDAADSAALEAIIAKVGWPGRRLVGPDGASAAWLIVQHVTGMQHEGLRLMLAMPPAETSRTDVAMLQDRVLVSDGKSQRFATQLTPDNEFLPIDDIAHLDWRRAEAGLPPIDTYLCMMRGLTGKNVKDPRNH